MFIIIIIIIIIITIIINTIISHYTTSKQLPCNRRFTTSLVLLMSVMCTGDGQGM
jgi:hypothetical protein